MFKSKAFSILVVLLVALISYLQNLPIRIMKVRFAKKTIVFTLFFLLALGGTAFADPEVLTGPVTGPKYFTNDTEINFTNLSSDKGALSASNSASNITADAGVTITINVIGNNSSTYNSIFSGIEATNSGLVDLSKNKVTIRALRTGLLANGYGKIIIGNDSAIYAYEHTAGIGLSAYISGSITVGDRARIIGTVFGDSSAVVVTKTDAQISIGDYAYILNDGTGNDEIGSASDSYGYHNGVQAYGGSITIGSHSRIETKASPEAIENHGVIATTPTVAGQKFIGTLTIGDDANVTTNGKGSFGVVAYKGGKVSLGKDNKITTYGIDAYGIYVEGSEAQVIADKGLKLTTYEKGSYGIYVLQTGSISLGNSSEITTKGKAAYALYVETGGQITSGSITIITEEENSYGVYIIGSDSIVNIGEDSKITTNKDSSHAIFIQDEANINLAAGTSVTTKEIGADAIYFFGTLGAQPFEFNDITIISEKANLITNDTGAYLEITFGETSLLYGDLNAEKNNSNIKIILNNFSTWQGSISDNTLNYNSIISLTLNDNSKWLIGKNSRIASLNMNDGIAAIEFLHDANTTDFYMAEIDELSGSGNVIMNVDLSFTLNEIVIGDGDFLKIAKAFGNYTLTIKNNGLGGAQELKLAQIEDASGSPVLLNDQEEISIGAYRYIIETRNNLSEWWLTRSGLDMKVKEETQDSVIGLGEFAKSIDATLSDEFLRTRNKLWFTSFYKLQKFDEEILNTSLKQQIGGGIAGLDKALSDNFSIGQFLGLNIGYQNVGDGSTGQISSLTTGIYANYANRGFLASGYVRVANYIHDLRLQGSLRGPASGTMNTYGWSASIQLSQKISLFDSGLYITPKAKATYTYVKEKSYDVGGMPVQNLDITGLVTWVGTRIGMEKNNTYEKPYGYYLETGWIHDTNPSVTVIVADEADTPRNISLGNNRFEVGVGFYTSPLGASSFNKEFKYAKGKGIEEPIKINIGGSVHY